MKRSYVLFFLMLASLGFFAFQHTESKYGNIGEFRKGHLELGGGQSGLTGAPGESNCSLCHYGSTSNGSTQNIVSFLDVSTPVSGYVPGNTYTVTLQLASAPARSGFSATALDATDTKAGSLIGEGVGGTQNFTTSGRDYVSHTAASNTSTLWTFTWVAPITDVGDVTFYVASNEANDDGSNGGDMIYISQHVISPTVASIEESSNDANFSAGYNATSNKLNLNFDYLSVGNMNLNLIDMNGRSVFTYNLGKSEVGSNNESITLPSDLKDGMYVVHFFVGNKAMSANILMKK